METYLRKVKNTGVGGAGGEGQRESCEEQWERRKKRKEQKGESSRKNLTLDQEHGQNHCSPWGNKE